MARPQAAGGHDRGEGSGRSLGSGLRGATLRRHCRRAVGGTSGTVNAILDVGNPLRQGVQVATHSRLRGTQLRHASVRNSARVAVRASATASMRCSGRPLRSTTVGTSTANGATPTQAAEIDSDGSYL